LGSNAEGAVAARANLESQKVVHWLQRPQIGSLQPGAGTQDALSIHAGQEEKVEEYGQNFKSLWDTVDAFGGSPGIHKGMTDSILAAMVTSRSPTAAQIKQVGEKSSEAVKAALLISGAAWRRYGALKDVLANNYLLGSNQYPNTLEKGMRILGNYQTTKVATPFRASPNNTGVAFLQRGCQGGRGGARGGRGGRGDDKTEGRSDAGGSGDQVSKETEKEEICEVEMGLSCVQTVRGNYEGFT
jgi:hypothetical protein